MNKKTTKKLSLNAQTIRTLTSTQLEGVAGGLARSKRGCHNTDACPTALNTCSCPL